EIPIVVCGVALIIAGFAYYFSYQKIVIVSVLIGLVSFGYFRSMSVTEFRPTNHISNFTSLNEKVEIKGKIIREPDIRDYHTYLTVATDSIMVNYIRLPVIGRMLIKTSPATHIFRYGDYIKVHGYLNDPPRPGNPNLFDYRGYLSRKGIFAYTSVKGKHSVKILKLADETGFVSDIVQPIRHYLLDIFSKLPTEEHGALLAGFLLGERRGIPREIQEDFIASGTMHLLAVSGSNVALILGIYGFIMIWVPVSKKWKLLGSIPVIIIFSFITNNEPSVVRASIMAVMVILAFLMKRRRDLVNGICVAGFLILLVSPLWLFDVGFQLSFAAVIGIVLYTESNIYNPGRSRNTIDWFKKAIIHGFFISSAAFLFTAPIIAYNFNRLATYSILANIPAAILISAVTATGAVAVLLYPIGGFIREGLLLIVDRMVGLMRWTADFFSGLPYASPSVVSPDHITIIAVYAGLLFLLTLRWNLKASKIFLLIMLIALNIKIWSGVPLFQSDQYRVEFLDSDFSESLFIYSDHQENSFIYSGDERTFSGLSDRTLIPYFLKTGFGSIDNLFLVKSDSSAIKGLEDAVSSGIFKRIWLPDNQYLVAAIKNLQFRGSIVRFNPEDIITLDDNVKHVILFPDISLRENSELKNYPILVNIKGLDILFLGETNLKPINPASESVDIMQVTKTGVDWHSNDLENTKIAIVVSGEPFRYWKETDSIDSKSESGIYKIVNQGAVRFEIGEFGIAHFPD
ncbi:MAG: DUF4131 domain-containing protein, partial [candidate division Zixibacteria bacterium]|nr:DUF4131 domain-containing protein [candidate division Zixibacteria bacterium]